MEDLELMTMRVLVTGHKGYIGSCLVPQLLADGFEVGGLDSDLFRGCTFDGELASIPEVIKDVRDVNERDLEGYDAIIHLAGLSNDPLGDYDPSLTDEINCRASIRLAELARTVGVRRFVFASSCSNYGASGDNFLDEGATFNPVTPYGVSKVNVERAVSQLATDRFSPTFLRASTAYGMSPRIRFDLVLNNLTAWALTTGRVYLKSDGTPWRPIVHVEDIARAYAATLKSPIEAGAQRGVQRRHHDRELPDPGACGDGRECRAGLPGRVCSRCGSRQALLPRRLQPHRAHAAWLQAPVDGATRRGAALRRVQARGTRRSMTSRASGSSASRT